MNEAITCASGVEQLLDYLGDALPPGLRARLEAHVAGCARCTAFVASYRATPEILRRATLAEVPPGLTRSLLDFVRSRG